MVEAVQVVLALSDGIEHDFLVGLDVPEVREIFVRKFDFVVIEEMEEHDFVSLDDQVANAVDGLLDVAVTIADQNEDAAAAEALCNFLQDIAEVGDRLCLQIFES